MKTQPTFEDQTIGYVESVQYFTSGEHDRATELYDAAKLADSKLAEQRHLMAVAQAKRSRKMYYQAHDQAELWYEDGRDAVTEMRALINNAKARSEGHPRAAK